MVKRNFALIFFLCLFLPSVSMAHFGMIIPDRPTVMDQKKADLNLNISFSHPFEQVGMDMQRPKAVGVYHGDSKQDLLGGLSQIKIMEKNAWKISHKVTKPGSYIYYVEPTPYYEKAEDKYILHITKVVVGAFGDDEGYDREVGLKAEVIPITRPYGLYANNVFQGLVKVNGKPVPFCDVEVEYLNEGKRMEAPDDFFVAQKSKTDQNGVFTFSAPWPGWWGFAALSTAPEKLEGKEVEMGAVIWVYFSDIPVKKHKK